MPTATPTPPPPPRLFPEFSFQPRKPMRYKPRPAFVAPPTPPIPPVGPPRVVSTFFSGTTVNLTFDQPVTTNGNPPDGSVTVNGVVPTAAGNGDAVTLYLAMPGFVNAGDVWEISAQPGWIDTVIEVPEGGTL